MAFSHGDEDILTSGLMNLAEAATALTELVREVRVANRNETSNREVQTISDDEEPSPLSHDLSLSTPKTQWDSETASRQFGDAQVASSANEACKEIFPQRLMQILADLSISDIITWIPHGRSFWILRPEAFTEKILPLYFPEARGALSSKSKEKLASSSPYKYPSFTRKLNRWGFRQITKGPDTGAFHHKFFRRDEPELCLRMVCQKSRRPKIDETGSQQPPEQSALRLNQKSRVTTSKDAVRSVTDSESVTSGSRASVDDDSHKKRKLEVGDAHGIEQISFPVPAPLSKPPPLTMKLPVGHGNTFTSTSGLHSMMNTIPDSTTSKLLPLSDVGIKGSKLLLSVLHERSTSAQGALNPHQSPLMNFSGIVQPNLVYSLAPSPATLPASLQTLDNERQLSSIEVKTEAHIQAEKAKSMLYQAYIQALSL